MLDAVLLIGSFAAFSFGFFALRKLDDFPMITLGRITSESTPQSAPPAPASEPKPSHRAGAYPPHSTEIPYSHHKDPAAKKRFTLKNCAVSGGILLGASLLSVLFYQAGFTESNIIMVYILGVLLTSIATSHTIYSLISSIASVVIFNFLFTTPRFSFRAYETGYPVTFLIMFLTAYITGTLAIRYKEQAGQSATIAHRTKILLDTDRLLSKANGKDAILQAAAEQIHKLLERDIILFENVNDRLSQPRFFPEDSAGYSHGYFERERCAAEWVLTHNQPAGATTATYAHARYLYFPLRIHERVCGVVGIEAREAPLDPTLHEILLSILGEAALALENEKNAREKEAATVLAESEQLRANLLRTISHDLRTPLTSISGNASILKNNGKSFDEETKQQIYTDIYDDSMWLIELVENLLHATRIEDGRMALRPSTQLLSEIIEEATARIRLKTSRHPLSVHHEQDLLLVKADAKLMVQVVANILDNAVKYTPPGSSITVTTRKYGDMAEIRIADTGEGIAPEDKEHIFEKFYCGNPSIADRRRSLGLGLYLCKEIVKAHGGTIFVSDNRPHGAVFCFTLPLEEVYCFE